MSGDSDPAVAEAAAVLLRGGVIAAPTETVYGLMTLWGNSAGRNRIFALKQRPEDRRLQMLAAGLDRAFPAGVLPSRALERIADAFWPGPLTVVVESAEGGTIGLRIPAHPFVRALLHDLSEPLAATSANRSGRPPALDAEGAVGELEGRPDLLVDGGRIEETGGAASTVASIVGGRLELLREGPVSLDALRRVLG